ncbi:MAG TPA: metallophosphoesterase [Gemmatimonadaceae bacterium]
MTGEGATNDSGAAKVRVFHVSDLHFGERAVPGVIEAIRDRIAHEHYDVVAVSGDLSVRARAEELIRGRAFLDSAARVSQVIAVPGNHDVTWWRSPMHLLGTDIMYRKYRHYVRRDIQPVLRVPGATFVGLNTAQGVSWRTLTTRVRDLSIIGDLRLEQIDWAHNEFRASPETDARVIVMHHNPVKGELSKRHGLKHTPRLLGALADIGVDLVLCGHDHQEAIHYIEHTRKGMVISTAGTVSHRSRGGRPSSVNVVTIEPEQIEVCTLIWDRDATTFVPGPMRRYQR